MLDSNNFTINQQQSTHSSISIEMQFQTSPLVAVLALAAGGCAHFVLQIPTSLGFDDALEATGPCGSFKPTDRSTGVTTWPVGGGSVGVLTTHTQVTWNFKAALLSDPANFVSLVHDVSQKGVGSVCFPSIPGNPNWVGQDAVLQVIQNGVDGTLYQVGTYINLFAEQDIGGENLEC